MATVTTGLDRWLRDGAAAIGLRAGERVGLLVHPASVARDGRHLLECLDALARHDAGDPLRFVRLFAPEHGVLGHAQDMEATDERREPWSGLPVVSLYGDDEASLTPERADLEGLDVLVADLQDVGARYYTYLYTLTGAMAAAGEAGVRVVVLDRPNPIAEQPVDGPPLRPAFASFVGRHELPVTHGLTLGELAVVARDRFGARCDLSVVALEGWERGMPLERCDLPWVPPSPNMPAPATARLYPGACLVEGTTLSEGRGTTTPFELVGAPWLDGRRLAESLRGLALPGMAFRAASFRPMFQKHAGEGCQGVQVLARDASRIRPLEIYLALIAACRLQDPAAFDWRRERYEFVDDRLAIDLLCGDDVPRGLIERDGASLAETHAALRGWLDGAEERLRPFRALHGCRYGRIPGWTGR